MEQTVSAQEALLKPVVVKQTMSVKEAAHYLGVHHDTIYNMVRAKEIPHFRLRKRILFTRTCLDDWIKSKETQMMEFIDAVI